MYRMRIFVALFSMVLILQGNNAFAGLSGSLDDELNSLVESTGKYLVTVKGEESWSNLIASGIVINEKGYVVTSSPAFMADKFEVTFKNGDIYDAEPVGVDHETGLAVVKINSENSQKTSAFKAKGKVEEGDWVLVVGNSYDRPAAVSLGKFDGIDEDGFLKLDVNVNPGSSGGAVLDSEGKIIGIIVARQHSFDKLNLEKMGYALADQFHFKDAKKRSSSTLAIPIDKVISIADELIQNGEIKRGFLGISQQNLSDELKKENHIDNGVLIIDIVDDSPADRAGLRENDIIVSIDGKEIKGTSQLYNLVRSRKPGDSIELTYLRNGAKKDISVVLDESKEDYFLGSLDMDKYLRKLKVGNKLIPDGLRLHEDDLSDLREEIDKLRQEIDELKERLAE